MNKWYKSYWMKGLLCLLFCLSTIICTVFGANLIMGMSNSITWNDIIHGSSQTYSQSEGFASAVNESEYDIISQLYSASLFETNGEYDENKLVDIPKYVEEGIITGKNESGFAYTIKELTNWYSQNDSQKQEMFYVACQRPDGSFDYYTVNDFERKLINNELQIDLHDGMTTELVIDNLYRNVYNSNYSSQMSVLTTEQKVLYSDFWTLTGSSPSSEIYPPDGADTILDVANNDSRWNGRLSEMLSELDTAISTISIAYADYYYPEHDYSEGNSNLVYILLDKSNQSIYTNRAIYKDYNTAAANIDKIKKMGAYVIVTPDLDGFETNLQTRAVDWRQHKLYLGSQESSNYIFAIGVDTGFPIQDDFYTNNKQYEAYMPYIVPSLVFCILSLIVFLVSLVWLTVIAGRNNRGNALAQNGFDKIWTEIAFLIVIGLWGICIGGTGWLYDNYYLSKMYPINNIRIGAGIMLFVVALALISAGFFLWGWLSLVRRIKAHTVWKNSLLRKIWKLAVHVILALVHFIRDLWTHRRQNTKIVAIVIAFMLLHFFAGMAGAYQPWLVFLTLFIDIAAGACFIHHGLIREKIKQGIKEISSGNVTYHIDTTHMKGSNLEVAVLVNNIGSGLRIALEQNMKDERMKTDLITNVSHDIKTPLTSIINYIDLLKRENFTDPKILGYLDILEQKSQRLKNLTEDVVEASRASSGNVTLEMMDINFVEMINQIEGEYADKFDSRHLQIVMNAPDQPVIIHADGRRLFRILENLYSNAFKYAMEGTRIYADLQIVDNTCEFSLKNVSEQALNISATELTERFIRGDVARTTEGSGLGLSIAKSLTELQGGTFTLYLDGDLFKVTVGFPVAEEYRQEN